MRTSLALCTLVICGFLVPVQAQDTRFPSILLKGADLTLIECEITRVLDDGTISFKPTGEGGLEQGVVYAVLVNKREITRIQVSEEKAKASLAKPPNTSPSAWTNWIST
jgi:hypothetical protein